MLNFPAMASSRVTRWQWLRNGDETFAAMLAAIDAAQKSVRFETYIYSDDAIGRQFLAALLRAQQRGAHVCVLVDAIGSFMLPGDFFSSLVAVGGEARVFNPLALRRLTIRDHRKLLVCDEQVAFIGGYNICNVYAGDGVSAGWFDLGLRCEGELCVELARSFDTMFALADFRHKRLMRLRRSKHKYAAPFAPEQLLLGGPGRGTNPIRRALYRDLAKARRAQIIEAYFLPPWRLRRALGQIARRGGEVELILAGKTDVVLAQLAGRSLYRRLLKSGVKIYEYQPQILHAKLIIVDDVVYVGSANLDPRSLSINYELMIRFDNAEIVAQAREIFAAARQHSQPINLEAWKRSRTFWTRLKERLTYYLLARVDPHLARLQWKALPE